MKKIKDIETWNRKEHYEFFSAMDDPFFGISTNVECSDAYNYVKEENKSFFLHYMHRAICVVNAMEEFRLRIEGGKVVEYDTIHVGTTLFREDKTFAFSLMPFSHDYNTFIEGAQSEMEEVKNSTGLRTHVDGGRRDQIHFTTVPWVSFTGVSHARKLSYADSVPKIAFGKLFERDGQRFLPVSVHAHHGLMDGYHASKFFELFGLALNTKSEL